MATLGIIGLGNMGFPMAENLLEDYKALYVQNRSQDKCEALVQKGATNTSCAKEIASKVDILFLSLPGPAQVIDVILGHNGVLEGAKEGLVIVDTSTVAPSTNLQVLEACEQKGVIYLDAPVSGGPAGIKNRTLTFMLGATEAEVERLGIMPYLQTIGKTFHFMGQRGQGSAIKIINNFMSFAAQAINGEALKMADALGISMESFYHVTTTSSGNNMILGAKKNKILNEDYKPGFALDLVLKDLELARQLCQDENLPNYTLNTAIQLYREAKHKGYGSLDSSSVIESIRGKEIKK